MSDQEKPLALRDKLAIEILSALIAGDTSNMSATNFHWGASESLRMDLAPNGSGEVAEGFIRAAYRMADIMRRVRLTAFE